VRQSYAAPRLPNALGSGGGVYPFCQIHMPKPPFHAQRVTVDAAADLAVGQIQTGRATSAGLKNRRCEVAFRISIPRAWRAVLGKQEAPFCVPTRKPTRRC